MGFDVDLSGGEAVLEVQCDYLRQGSGSMRITLRNTSDDSCSVMMIVSPSATTFWRSWRVFGIIEVRFALLKIAVYLSSVTTILLFVTSTASR